MSSHHNLRLIDGGVIERSQAPLAVAPQPLQRITRRPGEHRELYSFGDAAALANLRRAARRCGLEAETGIAVTVERMHITRELRGAGAEHLVEFLDDKSREIHTERSLWSAQGAYLQHLLGLNPVGSTGQPLQSTRVALPVRLIDRLGSTALEFVDTPEAELALAIAWEVASVVASETMTEWAYRLLALEAIDAG